MAKIHIENGIISSSADYSLYHGTSPLATVEAGGLRVQGDVIAENMIVSSSTTYMTTSFSAGSTAFGDTLNDNHDFTGSLNVTGSISIEPNNSDITVGSEASLYLRGLNQGIKIQRYNSTNTGAYSHLYTSVVSTDFLYVKNNGGDSGGIATDRIGAATVNPYNNMLYFNGGQLEFINGYLGGTSAPYQIHNNSGLAINLTSDKYYRVSGSTMRFTPQGSFEVIGTIEASGNISGSATSTGSFARLNVGTGTTYNPFAVHIQGTRGLRINHTGTAWDAQALRIDTTITSGRGLGIESSTITTGNMLYMQANSSDTSEGYMAYFDQTHFYANSRIPLGLKTDSESDVLRLIGGEGKSAKLSMYADDGDDNNDKWRFEASSGGQFGLWSYAGGSWARSWLADQDNTKLHIFENLDLSSGDFDVSGSATSTGSFGSLVSAGSTYIGDSTPIFSHANNMLVVDSSDSQILSIRRNNGNNQWNFGLSLSGDLGFRERTDDAGGGNSWHTFYKNGHVKFGGGAVTASGNLTVGDPTSVFSDKKLRVTGDGIFSSATGAKRAVYAEGNTGDGNYLYAGMEGGDSEKLVKFGAYLNTGLSELGYVGVRLDGNTQISGHLSGSGAQLGDFSATNLKLGTSVLHISENNVTSRNNLALGIQGVGMLGMVMHEDTSFRAAIYFDHATDDAIRFDLAGGARFLMPRLTNEFSGSASSTGSFGRIMTAGNSTFQKNVKIGDDLDTNAPRGLLDVRGAGNNQGFYVTAGAVGLPTDIVHSSGAGTFDLQPRNFRLGTSTGGPVTIHPKYDSMLKLGTSDDTDLLVLSGSTKISGSSTSTGSFGTLRSTQRLTLDVPAGSPAAGGSTTRGLIDINHNYSGGDAHILTFNSLNSDFYMMSDQGRMKFYSSPSPAYDGTGQTAFTFHGNMDDDGNYLAIGNSNFSTIGLIVGPNRISGSSISTGSFGDVEIAPNADGLAMIRPAGGVGNKSLKLEGSNSSNSSFIRLRGPSTYWGSVDFQYGYDQTNSYLSFQQAGTERVRFSGLGKITATSIETTGLSNAGGDISGSSTSTGSFGSLVVADKVQSVLSVANQLTVGTTDTTGLETHGILISGSKADNPELIIKDSLNAKMLIDGGSHSRLDINRGTSFGTAHIDFQTLDASKWIFGLRGDGTDTLHLSGSAGSTFNLMSGVNISGSATSTGSFGQGHFANSLGIGTTSPSALIHGTGTNGTTLRLKNTSSALNYIHLENSANTGNFIQTNADSIMLNADAFGSGGDVRLMTGNTIRVRVNEHGLGINATPADDIRLRVKASDNDDGIQLDDQSGNSLFKVFQQSDGVGRLFVGGSSSGTVFTVTGGSDASYVNAGRFGVGVTSPTAELDVSGSLQLNGNFGNETFTTGFGGAGFRIGKDATNLYEGEFDNLFVRGRMTIYELLINQIRASNGAIYVSDAAKVESVTPVNASSFKLNFDTGSGYGHPFQGGDLLKAQRFDGSGTYVSRLTVTGIAGTNGLTASLQGGDTPPSGGFEFVRVGSTSDTDRQGAIYLTNSDNGAPFIDIYDGVNSHVVPTGSQYLKVRTGKLNGITSPQLGSLSGFGFYASGSAFLEGTINATAGGVIGGWNINTSTISKNSVVLDSSGIVRSATNFTSGDGFFLSSTATNNFRVGNSAGQRLQFTGDNVEIYNEGNTRLVSLGSFNEIAGWGITTSIISSSAGNVQMDAGNSRFLIQDPNGKQRVRMGLLNANNQYGISGSDANGNLLFKLGEAGNEIAGWALTQAAISSSDGNVQIDSANSRFLIKSGSGERVRMGLLNNSNQYGISGSDASGNLLFKLGDAGNEIAGWEIAQGLLRYNNASGSIALDASNQNISIHTGSINTAKPKVVMGNLPTTGNTRYGFAVFSGSGDADISDDDSYSVLITKDKARLAGWDLVPGRLKSGTVADINGNQAKIALGLNANQVHSTPQPSLFYVSASSNPTFFVGENFSYVDDVLTAAGWKISKGQISSSNGQAILSGSGVLSLGSGTHNFGQNNRTYIDGPNNRMSIGTNFKYESNVLKVSGWQVQSEKFVYRDGGSSTDIIGLEGASGAFQLDGDDAVGFFIGDATAGFDALANNLNLPFYSAVKTDGSQTVFFAGNKNTSFMKFNSAAGLEVSSSNFHIETNGNVTMAGTVKASSGEIGGFAITSTAISSSNDNLILKSSGQITASAADISGKITADSGQIATFSITSGSIESSANAKRGLKLEPGESIRGYGNEAHSTTSAPGLFSFGVRTVAPPAGTNKKFTSTTGLLTNNDQNNYTP